MILDSLKEAMAFGAFMLSPLLIYAAWHLAKGLGEDIAKHICRRWRA